MHLVGEGVGRGGAGRPDHAFDASSVAAHDARGLRFEAVELGRAPRMHEELHEQEDRSIALGRGHGLPTALSGRRDDSLTEDRDLDKPRRRNGVAPWSRILGAVDAPGASVSQGSAAWTMLLRAWLTILRVF